VDHADYYEIEFNGMLYSTIRNNELAFNDLTPETAYRFRLRAVNADGSSEWAETTLTTIANPLEFAGHTRTTLLRLPTGKRHRKTLRLRRENNMAHRMGEKLLAL